MESKRILERKSVLDAVNRVLFGKTIINKFTTVHNIVSNMFLCCNRIPEFVASRYTRFRVQKSIKNGRKRVLDSVNLVLFRKTVSKKFIIVEAVVFIILLYYYQVPPIGAILNFGIKNLAYLEATNEQQIMLPVPSKNVLSFKS